MCKFINIDGLREEESHVSGVVLLPCWLRLGAAASPGVGGDPVQLRRYPTVHAWSV